MSISIQTRPATTDAWLYAYILQPHIEGAERLNRAWTGMDLRTFEPTVLSLKTRLIYLISGLALIIPLIASIVWVFMQTFGQQTDL